MKTNQAKKPQIGVPMEEKDKEFIEQVCKRAGETTASFCRRHIFNAARNRALELGMSNIPRI
jgi:hypothetical protein